MSNSTNQSEVCVYCGYLKQGLDPAATVCPECGESLDDIYIPAMPIPPRWWRIHRLGWRLFRWANMLVYAAVLFLFIALLGLIARDWLTSGSARGVGDIALAARDIAALFGAISLIVVLVGGLCVLARVPSNREGEFRKGAAFVLLSLAIPLFALIPLGAIAQTGLVSRELFTAAIALMAALVLIDVRMLRDRAAVFVRFTTNGARSADYDDGSLSVEIAASVSLLAAIFTLAGRDGYGVMTIAYVFAVLGWMGLRGRAAKTVGKELAVAWSEQHQAP